ncbi:hypothetical protein IGK86_002882 [Enterococcus sp. DIV1206]
MKTIQFYMYIPIVLPVFLLAALVLEFLIVFQRLFKKRR